MIRAEFWIPGSLPGLNELLGAMNSNRHKYNALKKSSQDKVALCARDVPKMPAGVSIWYDFRVPDKRKDPSNILAGGIKLIEDALVGQGILRGDGWGIVKGIYPTFALSRDNPGIRVTILGDEDAGVSGGKGDQVRE